jgi:lipoprotein-anchoring transpeptidase ErfK/SrfK
MPTSDGALRILVSLEDRVLWLVENGDTLFRAPVAVGRNETFRYGDRSWDWRTPAGQRRVLAMRRDPVWSVPDWHYYERSSHEGLRLVVLQRGATYALADGSRLEIRGADVVRAIGDRYWAVPPGREIVIDGVLYMPPHGTNQRRVAGVLGTRSLDLGDGYMIHGTNPHNRSSVGTAASHGCIRMHTADVERLFSMVRTGTPVTIIPARDSGR